MNQEVLNDPQCSNKIIAIVATGKKIAAVKTVRTASGLGLKESVNIVEQLTSKKGRVSQHLENMEDIFSKAPKCIERKKADRPYLINVLIFKAILILSYYMSNS